VFSARLGVDKPRSLVLASKNMFFLRADYFLFIRKSVERENRCGVRLNRCGEKWG
jgi:hypothetical protein